jgi:tubulin polyglutamylase TTLL6/13
MQNAYSQCKKSDPSACFQLLGFDIILDHKMKPILLEVNQNPSLNTET